MLNSQNTAPNSSVQLIFGTSIATIFDKLTTVKTVFTVLMFHWTHKPWFILTDEMIKWQSMYNCIDYSWTMESNWCQSNHINVLNRAFGQEKKNWVVVAVIPPASTKLKGGYTGITLSIYTPRFNKVERGVYWYHPVHLSVCPSVDRIVSALYLQQYSSDPFHICTSYQATSEGVSRVMRV